MGNKIKAIPEKAEKVLNDVVNEFGIDVLKDFIKNHNRKARKKRIRHNTRDEVVRDVLELMIREGYDRTRAVEKIAEKRHLATKTIDNHLTNFYREAKENNFYTYGFIYDNMYEFWFDSNYSSIDYFNQKVKEFCEKNNIAPETLELYHMRYKTLPLKEKKKYKLDFSNINLLYDFQEIQPINIAVSNWNMERSQKASFPNPPQPETNQEINNEYDIPEDEIPF